MMTRTLLGCFFALCLGFVVGCGGAGTETTVPAVDMTDAQLEQEDEDYEAQMAAEESEDAGAAE